MSVNIVALRSKLLNELAGTQNEDLLKKVYSLLGLDDSKSEKYVLSAEQNSVVEEAREQIKYGDFKSANAVDEEISEWLGK